MKKRSFLLSFCASLLLLALLVSCTPTTPAGSSSSESESQKESESTTKEPEKEPYDGNYKVVYLSDTHLYDWENMFFESSAQRIAWAVDEIIKEHSTRGKVDLVVIPGDAVNNWLNEYEAGTFDKAANQSGIVFGGWGDFELNGKTYSSQYKGVSYPAGSSGTMEDALGVLRILSFRELLEPLDDHDIPYIVAHGNHDCYRDEIWEMAFEFNTMDGYIEGAKKYKETAEGDAIIVPSYVIAGDRFRFVERKVKKDSQSYLKYYSKGYGTEFAYAMNEEVAYTVFNNFHFESEDPTANGFGSNASGRSWLQTEIQRETVDILFDAVKDYKELYCVMHSAHGKWTSGVGYGNEVKAVMDKICEIHAETPGKVVAIMDGHTHYETVNQNFDNTGTFRLTCGYLGVPMYEAQANFRTSPFSYRVVEKQDGVTKSYIVLMENDYPAYTFKGSSGAYIPAFRQEYTRRGDVTIATEPAEE